MVLSSDFSLTILSVLLTVITITAITRGIFSAALLTIPTRIKPFQLNRVTVSARAYLSSTVSRLMMRQTVLETAASALLQVNNIKPDMRTTPISGFMLF